MSSSRKWTGRLFQTRGPATAKQIPANSVSEGLRGEILPTTSTLSHQEGKSLDNESAATLRDVTGWLLQRCLCDVTADDHCSTNSLRSANLNRLTIPFLAADLEHAGSTVWNSLRDELTDSDSSDGFKRFLKTISCYYCE